MSRLAGSSGTLKQDWRQALEQKSRAPPARPRGVITSQFHSVPARAPTRELEGTPKGRGHSQKCFHKFWDFDRCSCRNFGTCIITLMLSSGLVRRDGLRLRSSLSKGVAAPNRLLLRQQQGSVGEDVAASQQPSVAAAETWKWTPSLTVVCIATGTPIPWCANTQRLCTALRTTSTLLAWRALKA